MVLGGALGVGLRAQPVHAALSLVLTLIGIAVLFVAQDAQFLAVVQVIVYAGAIVVLFLFVIMLMNLNADTEPQKNRLIQLAGVISGGILFLVILGGLRNIPVTKLERSNTSIGLIKNLGKTLFTQFVLPFEISSVLFLSAMIGAIVIGRKE